MTSDQIIHVHAARPARHGAAPAVQVIDAVPVTARRADSCAGPAWWPAAGLVRGYDPRTDSPLAGRHTLSWTGPLSSAEVAEIRVRVAAGARPWLRRWFR